MGKAVVTGIGMLCALGNKKEEILNNILKGQTGIRNSHDFGHISLDKYPIGKIQKEFNDFGVDYIEERTHFMAKQVIDDALIDSGLNKDYIKSISNKVGMSTATSVLRVLKMQEYTKRKVNNQEILPFFLAGDAILRNLSAYLGVTGECYTTSTACSSSTAALGLAKDLIEQDEATMMIVVASDPLVDMSIAGFNSLQNISSSYCKPFDKTRDGITLGEAAVCFIIEDDKHASNRGASIYAQLLGYGLANDAYAITAPDPSGEGAYYAMKKALEMGKVEPEQLCYINAHGTGTLLNDAMEIKAIDMLYEKGTCTVPISSTKSYTGHCLASAGAIEMGITTLCLQQGFAPPTITLEEIDPAFEGFNLIKDQPLRIHEKELYALSNSFAFGGNTASVLFKVGDTKNRIGEGKS